MRVSISVWKFNGGNDQKGMESSSWMGSTKHRSTKQFRRGQFAGGFLEPLRDGGGTGVRGVVR